MKLDDLQKQTKTILLLFSITVLFLNHAEYL
jgi:hypothetical protein